MGQAWVQGEGFVPLSNLLSITNSTGGYVTDWSGAMTFVPPNTLRQANGTGLLVEEARTNLGFYSQLLSNAYWAKTGTSITDAQAIAPDGTVTGELVARTTTVAVAYTQSSSISVTPSATYTLTRIAKPATIDGYYGIRFQGTFPIRADALFNLNTCTLIGTTANTFTGNVASASWLGGWCLMRLTFTVDAGTSSGVIVQGPAPATASVSAWEAASATLSNAYTWGGNFEQRAFPTSYCPTTSAAATCNQDQITATGALLSALQSPIGTVFGATYGVNLNGGARIINTNNNTALLYNNTTGGQFSDGVASLLTNFGVGNTGTIGRIIAAHDASSASINVNGGSTATGAFSYSAGTNVFIGNVQSSWNRALNGYLTRLDVWTQRLPDTILPSLTTPQPVLVTDFANGIYRWNGYNIGAAALPSLFSVANSGGYCTSSAGLLVSFPSNTLRVCSGTGLLPEDTRTNNALWSQTFDNVTSWTTANATVAANQIVGPDGTLTADLLTADGTANQHNIAQTGVVSGTQYSLTTFVKKSTANFFHILVTGANIYAQWDLSSGNLVFSGAGTGTLTSAPNCTSFANAYWRCLIVFTHSVGSTQAFRFYPLASSQNVPNPSETSTASIYLWGAQLETGSFPTSYIPTTTVAVTRNFDNIQALGPVLNLLGTQGANSMVAAWQQNQYYASGAAPVRQYAAFWLDTGLIRWNLRSSDTSSGPPSFVVGDGAAASTITSPASPYAAASSLKTSVRWSNSTADAALSTNGAAASTVSRQLGLGFGAPVYFGGAGSGIGQLNSPLGCMGFFPGGLTNTQLQAPGVCY